MKAPERLYIWFGGRKVEYRRVEEIPSKRGVKRGTVLPPLYRNPITGDTWAGRGMKPSWVVPSFRIDKKQ